LPVIRLIGEFHATDLPNYTHCKSTLNGQPSAPSLSTCSDAIFY
jgi:hypothetical protein